MILNLDSIPELDSAADTRPHAAEGIDRLLELAALLPPQDRRLLEAFIQRGHSITELAELVGLSRLTIGRRIKRIFVRLAGPACPAAARNRHRLTGREWQLAEDWLFAGRSLRALARHRGLSLHRVRKATAALLGKLARLDS